MNSSSAAEWARNTLQITLKRPLTWRSMSVISSSDATDPSATADLAAVLIVGCLLATYAVATGNESIAEALAWFKGSVLS